MFALNMGTFVVCLALAFIVGCCTGHYIYKKFFNRGKKEK